jgi:cob(I)alamin adenosyltransferase
VKAKDQLLRNMELELKKIGAKPSNDTDGNGHLVTIDKLEKELEKVKEELAGAKEKLGILSSSNLNRLVEVATHRDRVRDLERDLEELEEKLNEENSVLDVTADRKRENENELSPRKRLKARYNSQDDDEIVL